MNRSKDNDDAIYQIDEEKETQRSWVRDNVTRASLWLLLISAAAVIISAVFITVSLISDLSYTVNTSASFFSKYLSSDAELLIQRTESYFSAYNDTDGSVLQLSDLNGKIVCSSAQKFVGTEPNTPDINRAILRKSHSVWFGYDSSCDAYIFAYSGIVTSAEGEALAAVRKTVGLDNAKDTLIKCAAVIILIYIFCVICIALTTKRFYRIIMAPISRVNETAQMIAEGTYGVHIDPVYPGEIGELCRTINNMSDAIGRSEKLKNDFISSVSHELRTPLTAIGGWGETLLSGDTGDSEELHRGLSIITNEASRLARMVEELLDFSRMESGNLTMQMEKVDIIPDIQDIVFMYMDAIRREGITLEYDEADDLPEIIGDRNRLRQVFLNLLDNAIKHGGEGRRVRVEAYAQSQTLIISVRDWGAGIPSEELPHVKERFYKGSSKARGSGIGLAVADEIMKLHGGRLEINSVIGEGTLAAIVLPAIIGNPDQ